MNGGAALNKKTIAYLIYAVLILCLAVALGYLLGYDKGETNIQITTVAPVTAPVIDGEETDDLVQQISENHPINLNTATVTELQQLPGIGPELAQRIIDYRQIHTKFVSTEQIMDVEGIGEKRYKDMENLITIGEIE